KPASNDNVKWAFDQTAHEPFDFRGVVLTVPIHCDDDVRAESQGCAQSCPGCRANAEIREMPENVSATISCDRCGSIAGAVVDHDRNDGHTVDLTGNPQENLADNGCLVFGGHDYRYSPGACHRLQRLSPLTSIHGLCRS